jgi:adenylate cyclase class IV
MNIEAEVRSFVSKERFEELLSYFNEQADFIKEDYQETFYFDCPQDLRIQKNNYFSKIWMKKGKLHDDHREEIEIQFEKDYFEQAEKLFLSLWYNIEIKWFRTRYEFKRDTITVCLDYTKWYGYIIELEKMCTEETKEQEVLLLKEKIQSLNIDITPKEEFNEKYLYYKDNRRDLVA